MRAIPQAAVDLVKASEGFRATRNLDPAAYNQIGYGHKLKIDDPLWDQTLSEEDATALAVQDLELAASELLACLGLPVVSRFTEGQWAALLDFVFNEGIGHFQTSTLCYLIGHNQMLIAADQLSRWVYSKGRMLDGLVTRRAAERALWLS